MKTTLALLGILIPMQVAFAGRTLETIEREDTEPLNRGCRCGFGLPNAAGYEGDTLIAWGLDPGPTPFVIKVNGEATLLTVRKGSKLPAPLELPRDGEQAVYKLAGHGYSGTLITTYRPDPNQNPDVCSPARYVATFKLTGHGVSVGAELVGSCDC
jgi:hypothetical protein